MYKKGDYMKDFKHVLWLIKQMIILGLKGDWSGSYEARLLLKLHLMCKSKKLS